ncbi:peroxisomal catalase A [Aspergillus chevalieri]|uniref:Peroxisomal catalase A n=1 Tax=Aspergillus chevalieri TaxID=182096 RepID=A0A7R7VIA0_ASPCH|nr:peroxisomal catalase A [Aspergillus chevalieri]BCR85211.1 peroxisomal catalase A [Aspergillus chevalieri]
MATVKPDAHPDAQPTSDYHNSAFTLPNGCPIDNPFNSEKVRQYNGKSVKISQLLQEVFLLDQLSHFAHERIPERLGHAKGTGAYGTFEVTSDEIKNYTCADFLQKKANPEDNKTPFFLRLSTTSGFRGSADTVRDTRGFAFKLYTNEGNLDWVFFWPEIFSIWDTGKIISSNHVTKKCPASGLSDSNMYFHFINNNLEAYNQFMRTHSDYGTPRQYSDMVITGINTYTFVKDDDNYSYVRITMLPEAPSTPFTLAEATKKAGEDPDFHNRSLFNLIAETNKKEAALQQGLKRVDDKLSSASSAQKAELEQEKTKLKQQIEKLPYPRWTAYAQIIKPEEVENASLNIFDASKTLPKDLGRTIEFGKLILNRNPRNQFTETEQAAFSIANVVPGWDISPDPILQARLFTYPEANHYRLGINCDQIPVNRPKRVWDPTRRDGPNALFNYEDHPTYIAEFNKTQALPGTNTNKSYVGTKRWFANKPIEVVRDVNEWDSPAGQLKQPWEFYSIELNGAPPAEDQDPVYRQKATEHGIAYKQWAFVHNVAKRLSACTEDNRRQTYETFKTMDTENWQDGKPTSKNLGVLIENETKGIIKESQAEKELELRN